MKETTISVTHKRKDNRDFFEIGFPKDQPSISISHSAGILSAGISLLIKAGAKDGNIKDYELLNTVIEYLKSEFISTESFEDSQMLPNSFREE